MKLLGGGGSVLTRAASSGLRPFAPNGRTDGFEPSSVARLFGWLTIVPVPDRSAFRIVDFSVAAVLIGQQDHRRVRAAGEHDGRAKGKSAAAHLRTTTTNRVPLTSRTKFGVSICSPSRFDLVIRPDTTAIDPRSTLAMNEPF